MSQSDKEERLVNQDTLAKIMKTVGKLRRNTPPPLEKEGRCYLRCPNCKACLKWKEDNGDIKEVWLPLAYFHDERVRSLCPRCKKPLSQYGIDPEYRNSKSTNKLFGRLRDR